MAKDGLTGEVFIPKDSSVGEIKGFQFEALISGKLTRLQSDSEVLMACVFTKGHAGFKLSRGKENSDSRYVLKCSCGKSYIVTDVNEGYIPAELSEARKRILNEAIS